MAIVLGDRDGEPYRHFGAVSFVHRLHRSIFTSLLPSFTQSFELLLLPKGCRDFPSPALGLSLRLYSTELSL